MARTIEVIDRHYDEFGTPDREVVVVNGARCYAEETRVVRGGTQSRRTTLYADSQAYGAALADGKLQWGPWA